jgi:hypothetical protein
MSMLLALALSIGVLIAVWTYVAVGVAALPVWAGIVAWATFFAAGGKNDGLIRTIASNLSGVFWAYVALYVYGRMGNGNVMVLAALVGVIGFAMVLQSKATLLGFIPGAFLGAATTVSVVVGANGDYVKTIIALVAGAVFGYISELIAGALAGSSAKQAAAA